jgi:hypothetical protein
MDLVLLKLLLPTIQLLLVSQATGTNQIVFRKETL